MKKIITLLVVGLLALTMVAGSATAAKKKKKKAPPFIQTIDGSVVFTPPGTSPPFAAPGCFSGAHRRVAIMTDEAEQGNGKLGYSFNIDKRTWGKKFKLDLKSATGTADLDIAFYQKFGTKDDVTGDPAGAGAPYTEVSETRAPGGEKGIVSKGMTKAIVCLWESETSGAAQATFSYQAGDVK